MNNFGNRKYYLTSNYFIDSVQSEQIFLYVVCNIKRKVALMTTRVQYGKRVLVAVVDIVYSRVTYV